MPKAARRDPRPDLLSPSKLAVIERRLSRLGELAPDVAKFHYAEDVRLLLFEVRQMKSELRDLRRKEDKHARLHDTSHLDDRD
jgi:hypothetical protein